MIFFAWRKLERMTRDKTIDIPHTKRADPFGTPTSEQAYPALIVVSSSKFDENAESSFMALSETNSARFTSRPEARGSGVEAVFRFLGSGVDFF